MKSKICYDVNTFVMMSKGLSRRKTRHHVQKFVIMSKVCQKFVMMSKIRHDVKRFVMTSKIYQKFIMMSKIRHDVKKFTMTSKHVMTSNSTS